MLFSLFLAAGVIVAGFVFRDVSGERQLRASREDADRLDPGWRFQDLEAKRQPFPPASKNGIDQIIAVCDAMPLAASPQRSKEWDALQHRLTAAHADATFLTDAESRLLQTELSKRTKAIGLARQLVDFPYGRSPIDLNSDAHFRNLFGQVMHTTEVAKLLQFDALWLANNKDTAGALRDLRAILAVCRCIGDEPSLLSQLVRISSASRASVRAH